MRQPGARRPRRPQGSPPGGTIAFASFDAKAVTLLMIQNQAARLLP
jgi:hypothetical protein